MHKEIVELPVASMPTPDRAWFDLETCAHVRLTSEDPAYPIESAFRAAGGTGWQAAQPGPQTIWLSFNPPQDVTHIQLGFDAAEARTQEFVLLASSNCGISYREIVRQQFNFSSSTPREEENYFPNLTGVTDLKLTLIPNISGGGPRATLRSFRVR